MHCAKKYHVQKNYGVGVCGGEEVLFFNPLIQNELEGSDILLQDI